MEIREAKMTEVVREVMFSKAHPDSPPSRREAMDSQPCERSPATLKNARIAILCNGVIAAAS